MKLDLLTNASVVDDAMLYCIVVPEHNRNRCLKNGKVDKTVQ